MKKRFVHFLVVSLALLMVLAPCWGKTTPKGSVVVALTSLGDEPIDPARSKTAIDSPIASSLGEGLLVDDLEFKPVPSVATSWRLLPGTNNLGWELKIRKGARFWDGTEVTPEDCKFSIMRIRQPECVSDIAPLVRAYIDHVDVIDDETIVIYSPKPSPWAPIVLRDRSIAIVPKAQFEKVGADKFNTVESLVACGEFKPIEHKRMQHFVMEANEDFYDPDRVPKVKRMKLAVVPELSTRIAMLQTGEADVIDGATGMTLQLLKQDPRLKTAVAKTTASYFLTPTDMYRPEPSPLKDKRVRQALAYAVDVDSIIKKIYLGEATASVGAMIPRDIGYDPTIKPLGYDPEKAKSLLNEAGYADGFEVNLQGALTPSTPLCDKVLEAVAGYWNKLGIKVNLDIMESGTYYAKYRDHAFHGFAAMSWPITGGDHMIAIAHLMGTGKTYSYYSDKQMDEWLDAQSTEMDTEKRAAIAKKIYRHWFNELVGIPIHHVNAVWGIGPRIESWTPMAHRPYAAALEYIVPK